MATPISIAWLGTGLMGAPMAMHLLRAGHEVRVYNRTRSKTQSLVEAGALACESPAVAARGADFVFSTVTDGPDVEAVLLGEGGALQTLGDGALCVDMSTIAPQMSRELATKLEARAIAFLEAPVTGGTMGAQSGTLSIMCGGHEADYQRARPLLELMGETLTFCGPHGSAQTVKLCNQVCGAMNLLGVCEALLLGQKAGVDPQLIVRVVSGGAARSWAMDVLAPKIIANDFAPGFAVDTQQKDMRLVSEAGEIANVPLPGAALAQQLWRAAQAQGMGEDGIQAMFKVLANMANLQS